MRLYGIVQAVIGLLQCEGRVSYRALQVEFALDAATLEALQDELVIVKQLAVDQDGVPLFVEELTKMLLESSLLRAEAEHYALTGPLAAVTIPGRAAAATVRSATGKGGSLLPAGPRRGPPPAGQVPGVACGDEPGAAVAATWQARRGPRAAGADLRLVH